ncbi:hypothetical protein Tco_1080830 [Tanacetum coccineum]|uniref:Uncharacterized protein n=1 Tax=Tanacetum coccineum TaxID=301880 RepID=A0ABQ5HWB3_9ASTR
MCMARTNMYQCLTVVGPFALALYSALVVAMKKVSRDDASPQGLHMQNIIVYVSFVLIVMEWRCIVMGDFNEVRHKDERYGSIFNARGADAFNSFISAGGLVESLSDGYSFTFWNLIEGDVVEAVNHFFNNGFRHSGGDPLSPFLSFSVPGKSLHLSFQKLLMRVSTKVLFLDNLCRFFSSFYADDVDVHWTWAILIFHIIVLDCFFQAISYLGVNIGSHMSRIKSWDIVHNKVQGRLSKWKSKVLSVLGATPIYYMSMYKAPMYVINKLEAIRSHFFNGGDPNIRKMTFVKWEKVLASKDKHLSPNMLDRGVGPLEETKSFLSPRLGSLIDDKTLDGGCLKPLWCKYVPLKDIIILESQALTTSNRVNLSRRDLYKSISRWWDVNLLNLSSYDDWWEWFSSLRLSSKLKLLMEGVFYTSLASGFELP